MVQRIGRRASEGIGSADAGSALEQESPMGVRRNGSWGTCTAEEEVPTAVEAEEEAKDVSSSPSRQRHQDGAAMTIPFHLVLRA